MEGRILGLERVPLSTFTFLEASNTCRVSKNHGSGLFSAQRKMVIYVNTKQELVSLLSISYISITCEFLIVLRVVIVLSMISVHIITIHYYTRWILSAWNTLSGYNLEAICIFSGDTLDP